MSTLASVIQRGTRAAQPAATAVPVGTLYFVTDETIIERSSGSAWQSYSTSSSGGGKIAQIVKTITGAVATGTTQMPEDDTIPQNSEGDQYMSLSITPVSATNRLKIEINASLSPSVTAWITGALFQDSTADALAGSTNFQATGQAACNIVFTYDMVAGTTSATTFKFRAGMDRAGTTTFNGAGGSRRLGGVMASSIVITEYVP